MEGGKNVIVQLIGNLTYPITLDPTVWIFDDRKILFENAFNHEDVENDNEQDALQQAADRFARETFIKPPVNKSISKFEREKLLVNTYVMPIRDFLETAKINPTAKIAKLQTDVSETSVTIEQLQNSLFLFAKDGKPLREDGPVHLYFGDGSNKDEPITNIKKIVIE